MSFLKDYNFSNEDIDELLDTTPDNLVNIIKRQKKLVGQNITYLKDLGVSNYQEIFLKYYDMFLMDSSNFKNVFENYDKDDLIEKLKKNINIVEYL